MASGETMVVDLSPEGAIIDDEDMLVRETEDGPDIWIPLSLCEIEPKEGDLFGGLTRGRVAVLTAPERVLAERGLV